MNDICLLDYINFNIDLLKISRPEDMSLENKKIDVTYNGNKIYVKTPKSFMPFNVTEKNRMHYLQISINDKPFTEFINKIDEYFILIAEKKTKWFSKKKGDRLYYSTLCKPLSKRYAPTMKLNLPHAYYKEDVELNKIDFNFKAFDEQGKEIKVYNLQPKNYLTTLIILDHFWINGNKCGINWNILQLRQWSTPTKIFESCVLHDEDDHKSIRVPPKSIPKPPISVPPSSLLSAPKAVVDTAVTFKPPTPEELKEMINKMKKHKKK